ncbi:adenylate/guanylate cyclase domain-containing protein [Nocardioides sp. SYSU D00038]|uniref:adenylate/guanylate cyclase domain-containing protein n=1 Tax=Nocardioides sp. SYSU D00038 TaxID=2812554 RepID=UPI0019680F22|nr:adenylate/guanylate cyclase domain-containing protein [Nocardioides sp. SYSU D00038]
MLPTPEQRVFGSWLLGPADQTGQRLRVRVQTLLTVMITLTNIIGAVVVLLISLFVDPNPIADDDLELALAISVPVYVVVAVVVGTVWGTTTSLRAMRWAVDGSEPTDEERRTVLRVPWRLTRISAGFWFLAAAIFGTLSLVFQPERAIPSAYTVALAGVVVGGIAYLLSEFALRPIAARALAGGTPDQTDGFGLRPRMVLFWVVGTAVPVLGLMTSALFALTVRDVSSTRLAVVMLTIGGIVLLFGWFITWLNARAVVAPIESVRDALQKVQDGDYGVTVPVYDGTELGMLQAGFNDMSTGLAERERLRDLFGRHVGHEVAAAAADSDVRLGGEAREVSVLFVDIVGSTGYAAHHDPAKVVSVLNEFFAVVVDAVDEQHGLVNKFVGDAALAIFGAPVEQPDHATRALAAARVMARNLAEQVPDVAAGIGVATGWAVAGYVGDESRYEYTVIGDAVNSASRLTDLAKEAPGRVLVAATTVEAADAEQARHWRAHDDVVLRGRDEATRTCVLAELPAEPATSEPGQ